MDRRQFITSLVSAGVAIAVPPKLMAAVESSPYRPSPKIGNRFSRRVIRCGIFAPSNDVANALLSSVNDGNRLIAIDYGVPKMNLEASFPAIIDTVELSSGSCDFPETIRLRLLEMLEARPVDPILRISVEHIVSLSVEWFDEDLLFVRQFNF